MSQAARTPRQPAARLMQVLLAPVISEKSTFVGRQAQPGTRFALRRDATKPEIKAAVEFMFKVQVESVTVANVRGKDKRFGQMAGPAQPLEEGLRCASRPARKSILPNRGGQVMLVKLRPITPGQRQQVKVVNPDLHKGRPVPHLVESKNKKSGRNVHGEITMRHQGGGHKQHLPQGRLQAQQGRHHGEGRAPRIRSQPQRVPRAAAATPTASGATSSRRRA